MGKVREFLKNLFSFRSLVSGLIGLGIGIFTYTLLKLIHKSTFHDILIFIGVGIGFILVIFILGFLMNNTLFKDDD